MAKSKDSKAADPEAVADEKLVPVELLVSEAGYGFRAGEIRGFAPDVAAKMIQKGHARAVEI